MHHTSHSPYYLVRTARSCYCFRLTVPKDLREIVGKTELRYSLQTGFLGQAKQKSRFVAGQVQLLFGILRRGLKGMGKLSEGQVPELVGKFVKQSIERWDRALEDVGAEEIPPFDGPEGFYGHIDLLSAIRDDLVIELNRGNYQMLERSIQGLLKENGIEEVDKESPAYRRLAVAIHQAEAQLIPLQQQHLQCDFSYRERLPQIFPDVFRKKGEPPPSPTPSPLPAPSPEPGIKVSQVFDEYWPRHKRELADKTIPENERTYNHFLAFVGKDTDLKAISKETIRNYIKKLRTEKNKRGQTRKDKTITGKYLAQVNKFLQWSENQGYIDKNPMKGMVEREKKEKRPDEERSRFSIEELKRIYESPEYVNDEMKHPYQFWLPLIGLYTGMRIEEICQLYIADFKQHEDIWYFDLNQKREDNSIKNSERRLVPLHPFLTRELNFVGYVQSLPNQEGRIFPELRRIGKRYSHAASTWFSEFKARCGIVAEKGDKTYHSFRHTLRTHLAEKNAPSLWKDVLTGHARSGEGDKRYTHPDDAKVIYENTVAKIDYGIDLSHLKNSKWSGTGS